MKIILTAFGKMSSQVMDVPEDIGPVFKMVLTQPLQAITSYSGEKISEVPPMDTMCEFEWTGKMDMNTGARHFFLRNIKKIN